MKVKVQIRIRVAIWLILWTLLSILESIKGVKQPLGSPMIVLKPLSCLLLGTSSTRMFACASQQASLAPEACNDEERHPTPTRTLQLRPEP